MSFVGSSQPSNVHGKLKTLGWFFNQIRYWKCIYFIYLEQRLRLEQDL